jgi:hypothetical protein
MRYDNRFAERFKDNCLQILSYHGLHCEVLDVTFDSEHGCIWFWAENEARFARVVLLDWEMDPRFVSKIFHGDGTITVREPGFDVHPAGQIYILANPEFGKVGGVHSDKAFKFGMDVDLYKPAQILHGGSVIRHRFTGESCDDAYEVAAALARRFAIAA